LIRHFGSVKAIKEAEPGEIAKVKESAGFGTKNI